MRTNWPIMRALKYNNTYYKMRISVRFWDCNVPASDGSRISLDVFKEYLASPQYKEAIESRSMLSSLTHRSRNLKASPADYQNMKGTVGNDDILLCVDHNTPAPIMYIEEIYHDPQSGWMCATAKVLDENLADEDMAKQIRRFKALLREGVKPGVSCVIVGFWSGEGSSGDVCKKIKQIKGIDITLNPSQREARLLEVLEDEEMTKPEVDIKVVKKPSIPFFRTFSDTDLEVMESGKAVTKLFSTTEFAPGLPKTSKIGLNFTTLKVKGFSVITPADIIEEEIEKTYSVGSLKERLRMSKLSPRQSFRRLVLDYRQLCKSQGGPSKMDPEDMRVLKSLFTSDVLMILREIHPDILAGKQIATLLGASSLGKTTRLAAQKLQIPYKLATKEVEKSGMLSKPRFQKLQEAYTEFINSMISEVFGETSNLPQTKEVPEEEENTKENNE